MNQLQTPNPAADSAWDRNRSRILEAAGHLFLTHGYEGTTMKAVAEMAACSVGYLYKHFTNKQELLNVLLAVHLDVYTDIRGHVRKVEGLQGLDCLLRELELVCDYMVDRRALIPIFGERESSQSDALRRRMQIQRREDIAMLDLARLTGEIPDMDPAILSAVIDGAIWALFKDLAQTERREVFLSIPGIIDRLVFTPLRQQVENNKGKDARDS